MKNDELKTATCRYCNAEYGYTNENRHRLLPFMCWRCTDLANERWERLQADRQREQKPF